MYTWKKVVHRANQATADGCFGLVYMYVLCVFFVFFWGEASGFVSFHLLLSGEGVFPCK